MKSHVRAKRRWFTPRNYARVALRTRWGGFERALGQAFLAPDPARQLAQALAAEVRQTLLNMMYEHAIRPTVRELMRGLGHQSPIGLSPVSASSYKNKSDL